MGRCRWFFFSHGINQADLAIKNPADGGVMVCSSKQSGIRQKTEPVLSERGELRCNRSHPKRRQIQAAQLEDAELSAAFL